MHRMEVVLQRARIEHGSVVIEQREERICLRACMLHPKGSQACMSAQHARHVREKVPCRAYACTDSSGDGMSVGQPRP